MDFVEVLERVWQLRQHRRCVAQVHAAHVVALEGVHEALGHAIALRTANRRVDWLQAQRSGNAACLMCDIGAAIIGEELQFARLGDGLNRAKAPLHCFHQHVAHWFTWQPFALPGPPRQYLPIAAVLGEGGGDRLSRIALDLETIGAPAHIAHRYADLAIVNAARMPTLGCFGQQQLMPRHDAVSQAPRDASLAIAHATALEWHPVHATQLILRRHKPWRSYRYQRASRSICTLR